MLAPNHSTTLGSGWWQMDETTRRIWLYARSQVFGPVKKDVLKGVISRGNHDFPVYTSYFSRESSLEATTENCEKL